MIRTGDVAARVRNNFPRIRGDDPPRDNSLNVLRGIFPVFAGMIPMVRPRGIRSINFPRIRGDDPFPIAFIRNFYEFSPYSRG